MGPAGYRRTCTCASGTGVSIGRELQTFRAGKRRALTGMHAFLPRSIRRLLLGRSSIGWEGVSDMLDEGPAVEDGMLAMLAGVRKSVRVNGQCGVSIA